jgi:hypothetical protein
MYWSTAVSRQECHLLSFGKQNIDHMLLGNLEINITHYQWRKISIAKANPNMKTLVLP